MTLKKEDYESITVPKSCIPPGAKLVEAYETDGEIVVMGMPADPPEGRDSDHNCDAMGCGFDHVLYRFKK